MKKLTQALFSFMLLVAVCLPATSSAKSGVEIDIAVNEAIQAFKKEVKGSDVFLRSAAGILVFPKVYKAGIGVGGEYGEGALRVGGKTVDYYSTAAASIGFQLGGQAKTIVIAFMTQESLKKFRDSTGWKVGVDGSVALIDLGAGKTIDTDNIKDPVIGFIFGSKGLMYNLTLEGSKFSKLDKAK